MPVKRKTKKTKKTRGRKALPRRRPRRPARSAGERLRETWAATLSTLNTAEENLQKQVRLLLKRNKISTKDASVMLRDLRALVDRERKRALKDLEARVGTLQARLRKERKAITRLVGDAVQGTLASFNIPSRREVAELTRKVDQLSKKIDRFKRR